MTSTPLTTSFKVLAFDADDTLWDCHGHFEQVMQHLYDELLPWVSTSRYTPSQLLMVGNSLKSDIAPAFAIGAWAVHIPFHVTWELEHTDTIEHPRLTSITHFDEPLPLLL